MTYPSEKVEGVIAEVIGEALVGFLIPPRTTFARLLVVFVLSLGLFSGLVALGAFGVEGRGRARGALHEWRAT